MTTPFANEDLSALLDGELGDAETAALEAQLTRDPALAAELDALRAAADHLRVHGPFRAPIGFVDAVLSRVEDEAPARFSLWAWLRRPFGLPVEGLALAAAAAAVILIVVWPDPTDELPPELHPAAPHVDAAEPPLPEGGEVADAVADAHPTGQADESPVDSPVDSPVQEPRGTGLGTAPTSSTPAGTAEPSPTTRAGSDELPAPQLRNPKVGPQQLIGVTAPYAAYGLETSDASALGRLQKLVSHLGGQITDETGQEIVLGGTLPTGDSSYVVRVPSDALGAYDRGLHSLGLVQKVPGTGEIIVADVVDLPLTVRLSEGQADVGSKAAE